MVRKRANSVSIGSCETFTSTVAWPAVTVIMPSLSSATLLSSTVRTKLFFPVSVILIHETAGSAFQSAGLEATVTVREALPAPLKVRAESLSLM